MLKVLADTSSSRTTPENIRVEQQQDMSTRGTQPTTLKHAARSRLSLLFVMASPGPAPPCMHLSRSVSARGVAVYRTSRPIVIMIYPSEEGCSSTQSGRQVTWRPKVLNGTEGSVLW